MAISIIDNFTVNTTKNIDSRLGPYASTDQATGSISTLLRYVGMTITITGSGQPVEYWFSPTTSSADLVLKTASVTGFVTTSSFNVFTSSYNTGSFTGSFIGTHTGSLFGTSSWASNAQTASYVLQAVSSSFASTASIALQVSTSISTQNIQHNVLFVDTIGPGFIQVDGGLRYNPNLDLLTTTSSYTLQALSSSFAQTASYYIEKDPIFTAKSGSLATTGSNIFIGNQTITGSLVVSGSTTLSGSLNVSGEITGSLFGTSSWASNAINSNTASYVLQAVSSSFASTASFAPNYQLISGTGSMLAPYVLTSSTSSMTVATASFAQRGNGPFSGSFSGSGANLNSIPTTAVVGNFTQIATGSVTASVTPTQFSVVSGSMTELLVTGTGVALGSAITDTHIITGSLTITGSNTVIGNQTITGSLQVSSSNATQFLVGSSSLFVNSAGNVGIGTTTPVGSLDILSSTTGLLRISGSGGSVITLFRPGATFSGFVKYTRANMDIGTTNSDGLSLFTNNVSRFNIDSIGQISITSAGTQTAFSIANLSNYLLFVSSSGQVGMGTGSPNATLDVNGSVNISGSGVTTPFKVITAGTGAGAGSLFVTQSGVVHLINSSSATQNLIVRENSTNPTAIQLQNSGNIAGNILLNQTTYTPLNNAKASQLQITGPAGGVSIAAVTQATTTSTIDFIVGGFSSAAAGILAGRFANSGRFLVNTSTDDGSNQLQVSGSTKITDTIVASGSANAGSLLDLQQTWNTTGIPTAIKLNVTNTASGATSKLIDVQVGGVSQFNIDKTGKIVVPSTITAPGTTGAQSINKISGKVNAAAATTSLVVTNNLVTTSSIVICQLGTNDSTCRLNSVVEANGSFTINYIAPTSETVIKFMVIN